MREATENTSAGITMGGRKINNLRYADVTTLLCESKEDLMELLTRIQHLSKEKGLLLNTRKTKIMVVDKNRTDDHEFILNGEELEFRGEEFCLPRIPYQHRSDLHARSY